MVLQMEKINQINQRQLDIEKKNMELQRIIFEVNHDICTLEDMNREVERRSSYGRSTGSNRNR